MSHIIADSRAEDTVVVLTGGMFRFTETAFGDEKSQFRAGDRAVQAEVGEAGAALARHWRGAGDLEHAVKHFVAAAEEAERGWAKQYAVTLYKEALDMTPADDLERVRFLRKRLAVAQQAQFHLGDVRVLGLGSESS